MTVPYVTALYACLAALMLVALSFRVIAVRKRERIGLGTGGNEVLERRVRAQGNFIEYVPMALALMLLAELGGIPQAVIHGLGVALIAGRLSHAWSLSAGSQAGRFAGMLLTFAVLLVGAGATMIVYLHGVTMD
jgi:hypothetical protein